MRRLAWMGLALAGAGLAGPRAVRAEARADSAGTSLIGAAVFPESIAYDQRTDTAYVSGNGDGSVQAVHAGTARVFQPGGTDGRSGGLGIKVDGARDRLWVVDGAAVYIYTLSTNTLLKKLALASLVPGAPPGLNDLAIAADGTAYITDSFTPELLKVDGATLALSIFRDLAGVVPYGRQNGFAYNLNGIVLAPDGRAVFAVKTNDGTLWRISLVDERIASVRLGEAVTKGDGLLWGPDGALYVVRNFEAKLSRIWLGAGPDDELHAVQTVKPAGLSVPTSAVLVALPKPHLLIANSQFGVDPPVLPFTLTELDLAGLWGTPLPPG